VNIIKPNSLKYYGVNQWPAENGLKYDKDIDSAIFSQLSSSDSLSSGELKRRIDRSLHRLINRRTYYNHLRTLVDDGLVDRKDTGVRGKQSVFYSVSGDAKRRRKLHLLRGDPAYNTVKYDYARLLFGYFESKSMISKEDIKIDLFPALKELLRDGLIKSKNNTKFAIADNALSDLIRDISELNELGGYKGKSPIIMGYQHQLGHRTTDDDFNDDDITAGFDRLKKKHGKTLIEYSFLSDVIQIYCPLLYPRLPYREFVAL
jgi:hypothetical protein